MTLAPLLEAPAIIQLHVAAAIAGFGLGAVQLAAPKGTIPHRLFGWLWTGLLGAIAVSSFFIIRSGFGGRGARCNLLSIFTLVMLVRAGLLARRHAVERHRRSMIAMFWPALAVPGVIAFALPGRIMNTVLFGS